MLNIDKPLMEQVEEVQQIFSWEEAISIGLELREGKDQSQWRLGDLALSVEKAYGVDSLGKFAIEININKNSLQQYRRVSKAFPPRTRSKVLSHRHHLILAGQEYRFDLLKEAEEKNLTTSQLEMRYSKNPQSEITKKEVLVCEHCHKFMVKADNICLCGNENKKSNMVG
jgi:hypothetical protein